MKHMLGMRVLWRVQCADLEPSYGHMGGTFGYIDQHSGLYCIMLRLHAGPLEFDGEV